MRAEILVLEFPLLSVCRVYLLFFQGRLMDPSSPLSASSLLITHSPFPPLVDH